MDPLSQLPLECVQNILQFLIDDEDEELPTFASLFRVNKYIASVALPFVFRDRFKVLSAYHSELRILARMLLDHVSIINPSTVLALALNLDSVLDKPSHSSMSRSPLNYLAHIQHLNLDDSVFTEEFYCSHNSNPPPSVLEYIQTDEFKEQCRSEGYSPRLLESEDVLLCHYKVFLYREASWWLAHPILEQLESMTIPLSCAHRYLGVVERLGNLQHVQFVMDQDIQYTPECASITNDSDDNSDMGTAHPGSATAKEGKWSGSTAAMIEFVKEHSRLFPVQLRTATCPPEDIWPAMYTICPNEVLLELCSILPPLSRPDFLGDENWMQFVAHPLTTDLRSVVDISRLGTSGVWYEVFCEHRKVLFRRCRSLKYLQMEPIGEGAFKWAVQEKRIKDGSVASAALLAKEETEHEDKGESLALLQEFGLVPLTSVNIKEDDVPITDEVDDIAYAFSETLQSLTVEMTYGTDEDEDENQQQKPPPIHVGRGWVDLPKLRDIWINKSDRLITHRMLLVHCPNVVSVSLTDESVQYWVQGIETCLPAHLPCLEKLTLEGWPALTFHPDTLHSTPKLTLLEVRTFIPWYHCFIPPVEELRRSYGLPPNESLEGEEGAEAGDNFTASTGMNVRPQWTWDWHLPHLTTLSLTSEFAFLFEFRMLARCPALEKLKLNMFTRTSQHTRVFSERDLFVSPSPESVDAAVDSSSPTRIVAPLVRQLRMYGRWEMDDGLLLRFLTGMFPGLQMLDEREWIGVSVRGWVQVCRAMEETLGIVHTTSKAPCVEEMNEFGLCHKDEKEGGERGNMFLKATVTFDSTERFVVRRMC